MEQIQLFESLYPDRKIRIMPDCHAGSGCVIGFTSTMGNSVIPSVVGVDIGCGVLCAKIADRPLTEKELVKLDEFIRNNIPSGQEVNESIFGLPYIDFEYLTCYDHLQNIDWLKKSVGSLGGGNHFIEVDVGLDKSSYLLIHTGSRNLGKQVATYHQDIAVENNNSKLYRTGADEIIRTCKQNGDTASIEQKLKELKATIKPKTPKELCSLAGQDMKDYMEDMYFCSAFAQENRECIANKIVGYMFGDYDYTNDCVDTMHNYIGHDKIIRKGAVSAQDGETLVIPLNMRDGALICVGMGNENWNCSAPHGAGRVMGRMQAKRELSMDEYMESMKNVYSTSVNESTIDEAPMAYKPAADIAKAIKPTVVVVERLRPIYNFKASE